MYAMLGTSLTIIFTITGVYYHTSVLGIIYYYGRKIWHADDYYCVLGNNIMWS